MFFTSVIYIAGLFAYFADNAVITAFIIMTLGIFAIAKNYLSPKLILFWYFVFFFAFFNASLRVKNSDALYQIAPQNALIEGQIVLIHQKINEKTKFFFNVSKINYNGEEKNVTAKTLVTLNNPQCDLNIGDFLSINGKLRTPFEASNPSQFDYGKYLKNFDIFTVFYANEYKPLNIKLSFKWNFLQGLNNLRNNIIQAHAKYLKSPNLELLGGVVFGDDAVSTPEEIKTSFKNSGLLHLLAASGMNVALIYGIWFFLLRKLKVPFNITVSSGIFIVIFYAMMTGLGPSVIRAAFMLIFILVGKLIDRDTHSISLLSFVALLMLIYNPAYINDVGFQLSFLVTFGLLLTGPIIFENIKSMPNWLSGAIFVPIIAQIWVAPIQMYYFNSFSLYSVFANILVLPFVTIISFGGFTGAVLAIIKPLADSVCFVFDLILNPVLNITVAISNYFSNLPHSLIQMLQPSLLQIFLYYGIVLLITLILKIGKNKGLIITLSSLCLLLSISWIKFPDKSFETIIFDVQNADAFLIKTPKNKYFLIDSGKIGYKGGKTQAKAIVLEYLKDNGIKNIEGLIITHFDSDHAGGAIDLIENLNIKNIYVNSLNDKSTLAKKIYLKGKNKVKQAKNNEIIYQEGKLIIKNFTANLHGQEFENENSIITLISDGNFDELFMGDAGIVAFDKLKNYLPNDIEILKIGHHGAKNVVNKEFLDRINPEIAIVSTGINNYGHPNGVTLNILEQHKVKILRTDRQNAIKINEEAGQYKIYTYNKNWELIKNDKIF
ncbi:MAG: DNA internalization-related competence protein ComEC/Rec2 [Candidatus Gastranaerophilales bacterium]|nr:DNA internalization-related competence protein ComEC/Rec2 [Candidatus Gastranaerophilales bacterium]